MTDDQIRETLDRYEKELAALHETRAAKMIPQLREMLDTSCADYQPDHNTECLNCDQWADAHLPVVKARQLRRTLMAWMALLEDVIKSKQKRPAV